MSGLCLPSFRSDVRLRRQLRSYELVHFLDLLEFAGDRRDPTFIPAKRRDLLRLWMGFGSGDKSREKFDARLQRFHETELIELGDDGSILLTYLLDQDDEEDDDDPDRRGGNDPDRRGSNALNGNGVSRNGTQNSGTQNSERRQASERRQPGRARSTSEAAVRKFEYRRRQAEAGEGLALRSAGAVTNRGSENETEKWDISRENVPADESKCPAVTPQMSQEMSHAGNGQMSQNRRDISGTSLAGVSPNVNVSGEEDNEIISDSGDVSNVTAKMSHGKMSQDVPRQNVPPASPSAPTSPSAPVPPSPRVPLRPGFEEIDAQMCRHKDVEAIMLLARDRKSRGFYIAAWKHCYANNALDCWDMAAEILAEEIRTGPVPGQPGHLPPDKYGASFNKTLTNLLRDNGTPYPQGTTSERDEVARQVRESLAAVDTTITPLDTIYAETEDGVTGSEGEEHHG